MTENRETPNDAANHIVAVFDDAEQVGQALDALHRAGIGDDKISVLARSDEAPEGASPEDLAEASTVAGKGVLKGASIGGALGGLAGLLGGAVAFAIPGIGPALGTGLLVAAVSGATAGATAGALWSGFERMWDMAYRDAITGGAVLVAVHTNDPAQADEAKRVLAELHPQRIDHLDAHGELVRTA
jgi:hypothetical protein